MRKKTIVALKYAPPLPPAEMFAAYPKNAISRAIPEVIKLARAVTTNKGFVSKAAEGTRIPG
jgi:hypothetical protein